MIKWSDLEVDNVYRTENFSVLYKVLYITDIYGVILCYENNHKVATLKFISPNEDFADWFEVDNETDSWFLKWLEYVDEYSLKIF